MPLPNPGWNVVYGEIPAASKWSQLGANDDALAAGTGLNNLAVTSPKIDFSSFSDRLSTDANGWRVYSFGAFKIYTKRFIGAAINANSTLQIASNSPYPSGTNESTIRMAQMTNNRTAYVEKLTVNIQAAAGATAFNMWGENRGGGASGIPVIDIMAIDA